MRAKNAIIAKSLIALWVVLFLLCSYSGSYLLPSVAAGDQVPYASRAHVHVFPCHALSFDLLGDTCDSLLTSAIQKSIPDFSGLLLAFALVSILAIPLLATHLGIPVRWSPQAVPVVVPIPCTKRFHRYND
jgi:hypothetical protein